jgi:hypothetical protein
MPVMIQRQKEAESKAVGSLIKAIFATCMPATAVLWVRVRQCIKIDACTHNWTSRHLNKWKVF